MSVLRKICGITRKDRRRNVDILKELSVEKDIVDLLQVRRLGTFWSCEPYGQRQISEVITTWLHTWTSVERKTKKEIARKHS